MNRHLIFIVILALAIPLGWSTDPDVTPPSVIETYPPNGSTDVDPSITEISVTFDEEMRDGNFSWAYTLKSLFPETSGLPYYNENLIKNFLPVKLQPDTQYEIWINSQKFKNFKDKAGNSAAPYRWVFKTR